MRTSRIRTAAFATATAALGLALTACGSGSGGASAEGGGKATESSVASTTSGSAKGSTVSAGQTAGTGEDTGTGENSVSGKNAVSGKTSTVRSGPSSAGVRACDGQEMSYSVVHRFPKQRGEHLLITATNADSKSCYVTSFPSVMLGDTLNVLPHSDKDAPGGGKALVMKPGGKLYAAVNLFTDSAKTHTSAELSIAMQDHTGDAGPGVEQGALDAKGAPSEFTWSDADVTNWNTAKPYDF